MEPPQALAPPDIPAPKPSQPARAYLFGAGARESSPPRGEPHPAPPARSLPSPPRGELHPENIAPRGSSPRRSPPQRNRIPTAPTPSPPEGNNIPAAPPLESQSNPSARQSRRPPRSNPTDPRRPGHTPDPRHTSPADAAAPPRSRPPEYPSPHQTARPATTSARPPTDRPPTGPRATPERSPL